MPTCRGITITLQSQFDAQILPELPCRNSCSFGLATPSPDLLHSPYHPLTPFDALPPPPTSPYWQHRAADGSGDGGSSIRTASLTTNDHASSQPRTVSVEVKVIPGCHLWINYACRLPASPDPRTPQWHCPPVSRESVAAPHFRPIKFLFFRLFINDRCVQRWGTKLSARPRSTSTGQQVDDPCFFPDSTVARQECSDKVMFGLFRADPKTFLGRSTGLERRALCFGKPSTKKGSNSADFLAPLLEPDVLEIQVFRSFGRTWDTVDEHSAISASEISNGTSTNSNVIQTIRSGHVRHRDPRRMYRYALLEPVDSPYAVFRFHCEGGEGTLSRNFLEDRASASYLTSLGPLCSMSPFTFDFDLLNDGGESDSPSYDGGDDIPRIPGFPPRISAATPPRRHSDSFKTVNLFSKPLPKIPEGSPTKRRSTSPKRADHRLIHKQVCLSSVPDLSRRQRGLDSNASVPSRSRASAALKGMLAGALKRRVGTGSENAEEVDAD